MFLVHEHALPADPLRLLHRLHPYKDPVRAKVTFEAGDQISHKTFGPGIVLSAEGDTIEVKFTRTNKIKKLMKGFAPIVKIES